MQIQNQKWRVYAPVESSYNPSPLSFSATRTNEKEVFMKGRTTREFNYPGDIWGVVENWAERHRFQLTKEEGATRLYQKGHWQLMAPACLEVTRDEDRVTLEAWVKADLYILVSLLTGRKPEARLDRGGLVAAVPRRVARNAVNDLLSTLGQETI